MCKSDNKMKFTEYLNEGKDFAKEFEKATGIKPDNGPLSKGRPEKVFFLKDKSSLIIYPGKSRMEYYDKNMDFITAYTSVKQAVKAFDQSGLLNEETIQDIEDNESQLEEAYAKSLGYKQTAEAIYRLERQFNPDGNLAKGIIKEGGSGYKNDFKMMQKYINKIIDIWEDIDAEIS